MTETSSALTTDLNASVAIIRFNRPAERTPLSIATLNELRTLALACDIRVAPANAVFAHPGARLGIIYGPGWDSAIAKDNWQGAGTGILHDRAPLRQP